MWQGQCFLYNPGNERSVWGLSSVLNREEIASMATDDNPGIITSERSENNVWMKLQETPSVILSIKMKAE